MEIFLALAIIERCTLRRIFYLNISIKIVLKVFDELIVLLGEQLKSAMSKGKTISAKFLKEFISNVNELKSELENQNIDN
jgi:hypothetical protein